MWRTGKREQGTRNREQGRGSAIAPFRGLSGGAGVENGEEGTGNREQGTGKRERGQPPSGGFPAAASPPVMAPSFTAVGEGGLETKNAHQLVLG